MNSPSFVNVVCALWMVYLHGVVVSMFDFHQIPVVAVKFHNVYDYTIVLHPWQVSENHKPRVHPSHVREIGQSVGYLTKHKIEL